MIAPHWAGRALRAGGVLLACGIILAGLPAAAFSPALPAEATETARETEAATSWRLPTGAWRPETGIPTEVLAGDLQQVAWRIAAPVATLDLAQALSAQLAAGGWQILLECETAACGGFDFRYGLALLPEPEMHVDLGDFRFIAARRGDEGLALMISRSSGAGFVQLTHLTPAAATPVAPMLQPAEPSEGVADLARQLEVSGSVVLSDLSFDSGASGLANPDAESLISLGRYLQQNPQARVALVGHTDTSGTLEANIGVSRARAVAVRAALIAQGIDGARIEAEGAGYLAPRASNRTAEGREQNRRVEVMLIAP